jgi:hypothetical protein
MPTSPNGREISRVLADSNHRETPPAALSFHRQRAGTLVLPVQIDETETANFKLTEIQKLLN